MYKKKTKSLVHTCPKCGKRMVNAKDTKEAHKKYCKDLK